MTGTSLQLRQGNGGPTRPSASPKDGNVVKVALDGGLVGEQLSSGVVYFDLGGGSGGVLD